MNDRYYIYVIKMINIVIIYHDISVEFRTASQWTIQPIVLDILKKCGSFTVKVNKSHF